MKLSTTLVLACTLACAANTVAKTTTDALGQPIETIAITGQTSSLRSVAPSDIAIYSADLAELTDYLPGLAINRNGPVTAVLQHRGLFGERMQVQFAGAPIAGAGPNAMDSPLGHLVALPNMTISMYQGIAPVSAGAETLSNVLQIEQPPQYQSESTHSGQFDGLVGTAQAGHRLHLNASHQYQSQDVFLQNYVLWQEGDNTDSGDGSERSQSFYERRGLGSQFAYRTGDWEVITQLNHLYTGGSGTAALNMDINFIEANWLRLQVSHLDILDGAMTLALFGNRNTHDMDNLSYRPLAMPAAARLNTVDSQQLGAKLKWQNDHWHIGADMVTSSHNSTISNPNNPMFRIVNFNDVTRKVLSGFIETTSQHEQMQLTFGLRPTKVLMTGEPISHHMAASNPNIGALVSRLNDASRDYAWQFVDAVAQLQRPLNQDWSLALDAGIKHRAPSYTEVFVWFPLGISGGLADGNNYLGNLELQEERAQQVQVGLNYQQPLQQFSVTAFYNDIDNYITGEPSSVSAANMISNMMAGKHPLQWQNMQAKLHGLDFSYTQQWSKQLAMGITGGIVKGTNTVTDTPLYRIAPAYLTSYLAYQHGHAQYIITHRLVAGQTDISPRHNELASSGYYTLDTNASFSVLPELQLSVGVENIFDRQYRYHLAGINRVTDRDEAVGERLSGLGRQLTASLRYTF